MNGDNMIGGASRARFAMYGAVPLDVSKGKPKYPPVRDRNLARQMAAPATPTNHLHALPREVMNLVFNELDAASRKNFAETNKKSLAMYRAAVGHEEIKSPAGFSARTVIDTFRLREQRLQALMQRVQDTPTPVGGKQVQLAGEFQNISKQLVASFGPRGVDARHSGWEIVDNLLQTIGSIAASENSDRHIAALAASSDEQVTAALARFVGVAASIHDIEEQIKTAAFGIPVNQLYEQAHVHYRKNEVLFPNLDRKGLQALQGLLDVALHHATKSREPFKQNMGGHVDDEFMKLGETTAVALASQPVEIAAAPKSKARSFLDTLSSKFSSRKS